MAPGSDGGFPVCLLTSACQESNRPLTFFGFYSHCSHNWCENQPSAGSLSYATSKCKRWSTKQIEESQTGEGWQGGRGGTWGWEWIYSFWLSLCVQHRSREQIFSPRLFSGIKQYRSLPSLHFHEIAFIQSLSSGWIFLTFVADLSSVKLLNQKNTQLITVTGANFLLFFVYSNILVCKSSNDYYMYKPRTIM